MEFKDKVVLVAEAGSGKAIAEGFAREGARVLMNDVAARWPRPWGVLFCRPTWPTALRCAAWCSKP